MASHFVLSVRFLAPFFHGRRDGGLPEWPPSPMRAFQALVAAAAARHELDAARPALVWLEELPAPTIVAPAGIPASGYSLSVPNNAMDIVARAWCRGNYSNVGDANPATHRTMKAVRPTVLADGRVVHYSWSLPSLAMNGVQDYLDVLCRVARSMVALGWGVDMVAGHGAILSDEETSALPGERWQPGAAGDGLRVPKPGSLDDLAKRHGGFLARLGADGSTFHPPAPLSVFDRVDYRRAADPPVRALAAFSLLKVDASGFRAFDPARRGLTVAGMMRHATRRAAERAGWEVQRINAIVLGHHSSKDAERHVPVGPRRFAYLPLPSIEARGHGSGRVVGNIRRVVLTSFAEDCGSEIAWARRALAGQDLVADTRGTTGDEKRPVALLSLIPATERVVRHYTSASTTWATVTPVVLPGYDDPAHYRRRLREGAGAEEQRQLLRHLRERVDGLLRKAMLQAGFPPVLAEQADLDWRGAGFWPGVDLAGRYGVPDHLKRFPRVHVWLRWRDAERRPVEVPGPICLGGGRFYGLGLFAAWPSENSAPASSAWDE